MKKTLYLFIIYIFISNCSLDKVVNNHGVKFIDIKEKQLFINKSNKNDIIEVMGPPSTRSMFDNDLWIYIERKNTKRSIFRFGSRKTEVSNALILEINNKGLLVKKDFYPIDKMNKIKFSDEITDVNYSKNTFVYDFLSSIRQKVSKPKN
jgi:outer membrane protein assembly factor BamE (lipoprotein component of BamABCDE complex)